MRYNAIIFLVLGSVAAFAPLGLCCRSDEYATSDGQCCPKCEKGTVVGRVCTSESGTQCDRCGDGTFMNERNGLTKCFSCSSCNTGQGLFTQQECTITTNTVCDVLHGYFCKSYTNDLGCSSAEVHTRCVPGQRIKALGTNKTDTVCEDCQPGYYSEYGVNCTAWTICSGMEVKEGSPSKDVVCRNQASRNHFGLIPSVLLFLSSTVGLLIKGRQATTIT